MAAFIIPVESINLEPYNQAEIIMLRERCNKFLPDISDLDLRQELVLQFIVTKQLMTDNQTDGDIPLNQKAQVTNSLTALLKQLSDQQIKLHSAERFRLMEQALTDTLLGISLELQEQFLSIYAEKLSTIA